MAKFELNKNRIQELLRSLFPSCSIVSSSKFSTGLVSPSFDVCLASPNMHVLVKLTKRKHAKRIHKNNLILTYLKEEGLPASQIFLEQEFDRKIVTVMELLPGSSACKVFELLSVQKRKHLLSHAALLLRRIHQLPIPSFWQHQEHEILTRDEWIKWTEKRVCTYVTFFSRKYSDRIGLIEQELHQFITILRKKSFKMVPLHWDFHLSNMNANAIGEITGVFDFDNAMKGHHLADLGQFKYWLRQRQKIMDFSDVATAYGDLSQDDIKIIDYYYLLHILAVSRTIWLRKRLRWLRDEHELMLNEYFFPK